MAQGFFAETLRDTLKAEALQPSTWVLAAGCGVAAMLCAIIAQRETVVSHVVGQLVAVAALVVAYIVCGYMENGGFGSALDGPAIGIAVILGATLCIAKILLGDGTRG